MSGGEMTEFSGLKGLAVSELAQCPKLMSNGPCAEVLPNGGCEVAPHTPCVWWRAATTAPDQRLQLRPPAEWSKDGEPHWSNVGATPSPSVLDAVWALPDKSSRPMRSDGGFERALSEGRFVVTARIDPPNGPRPQATLERGLALRGQVDAVHVTDNVGAAPRMTALALAALLERSGIETIVQLTCRDRNRLMLQADLLGLAAVGVKNILCSTGEHPRIGAHYESKPVFDLDSISLLSLARRMRDKSQLWNGRALEKPPRLFLGAGAEMSEPFNYRPHRLAAKATVGCDFAVTAPLTELGRLPEYLQRLRDLGLDRKLHILVTVAVRRDAPDAEAEDQSVRLIAQVRELPGVSGVVAAAHSPEQVLRVMQQSGLKRAVA
jgi:methylenetetrahydrofolate reductase (NADPH)